MASKNQLANKLAEDNPGHASEVRQGASCASETETIVKESTPGWGSQSTPESEAETESIAGTDVEEERTFELFPKLAPEIRCKIWKEVCSVTRNIDLWVHDSQQLFSALNDWKGDIPHFFSSSCPPPPILGTCKESRIEGLKHYTMDFGMETQIEHPNAPFPFTMSTAPQFFMNWKYDRLCLMNLEKFWTHRSRGQDWARKLILRCEEKKLRFLALNVWYGEHNLPDALVWNLIPWERNVEQVILFIPCETEWVSTCLFHDVDLDKVMDDDDDDREQGEDWEDWFRDSTLSELKRHTNSFKEQLAIRQKKKGRNADLELRSCRAPQFPRNPMFRRYNAVNTQDPVVKSRILSN